MSHKEQIFSQIYTQKQLTNHWYCKHKAIYNCKNAVKLHKKLPNSWTLKSQLLLLSKLLFTFEIYLAGIVSKLYLISQIFPGPGLS